MQKLYPGVRFITADPFILMPIISARYFAKWPHALLSKYRKRIAQRCDGNLDQSRKRVVEFQD